MNDDSNKTLRIALPKGSLEKMTFKLLKTKSSNVKFMMLMKIII